MSKNCVLVKLNNTVTVCEAENIKHVFLISATFRNRECTMGYAKLLSDCLGLEIKIEE